MEFEFDEEDFADMEDQFNRLMEYAEKIEGLTTEEKEDLQDSITRKAHHHEMMDSWHY